MLPSVLRFRQQRCESHPGLQRGVAKATAAGWHTEHGFSLYEGVTGGRLRSPLSQDMNSGAERGPKCRECLGRLLGWETVGPFRSISSSNDGTQFISACHTEAEANQPGRLNLRRFSGLRQTYTMADSTPLIRPRMLINGEVSTEIRLKVLPGV